MSAGQDRLYNLLPAVYRIRDAEQAEPLRALLSVLEEQAVVLEEDLAQLYDNLFVETAASWVLPYIAELIGLRGLPGTEQRRMTPRAEVANTISYRRRKGTAAVLEQLARDVSGWPARAVEFFELLVTTQYMNHLRPDNESVINIRDATRLEWLGTAFEHLPGETNLPHTADVRRIASGRGRYNIPNVGIFLWRLAPHSLTRSHAVQVDPADPLRYRFNPAGLDAPLFNRPETESQTTQLATPLNVPMPISRRRLAEHLADYYGAGKSLLIEIDDSGATDPPAPVDIDDVIVCDLSDFNGGWAHTPPSRVAVDPLLGRIAFPEGYFPDDEPQPVLVTFHYGFSAGTGGGEYARVSTAGFGLDVKHVSRTFPLQPFTTVRGALADISVDGGLVEITDSARYDETGGAQLVIDATGRTIELRSIDGRRPTLVLDQELLITGDDDGEAVLDGLLITGAGVRVSGPRRFLMRHCTLAPGATLFIDSPETEIEIDHCILGPVRADLDASVRITTSIIDAGELGVAYAAADGIAAGGRLSVEECTILGKVHTAALEMASNTIFQAGLDEADDPSDWPGPVVAVRRQEGCARFSYIPPGSRVPRRYRCQPAEDVDAVRVRPLFTSTRYGDPGYCQLSNRCADEIRRGAEDESEMGVFHDLFQPRREDYLRRRLDEYLRFGLEAGIVFAT